MDIVLGLILITLHLKLKKKFDPKMILSGRKTNEDYSNFLVKLKKKPKKEKNKIDFGTTFKPNCSDVEILK